MGWIGPTERIVDCLRTHCDRDEEGQFAIRGEKIASFMGAGEEFVLSDDVEVRVDGEWKPLIPMLYGGLRVQVL